ncbi:NaeI family type II restriction endonuclease [Bacillus sp. FJAT-27445]|uniref:NaeI family type II restriction endonuclease n=1 Tax=Bacillus sp. FJAT-27445 TaxID=1679166 RepID=UPI0007443820|nr:NaeI family type II restriction endonuclease [Bacillus sp. FJAT-27445]
MGSNPVDAELNKVADYLTGIKNLEAKVGLTIRKSIDEVISGRYTGRFSIDQIDKTEKTYIGTKVQHTLQHNLNLTYGNRMDALIAGIEVDIKFTIGSNWTIPSEAMGHLCLLISALDNKSLFQVGLIRITPDVLNGGENRDRKKTINKIGRENIIWLIKDGELPSNVLLRIDPQIIERVYIKKSGQERINELFRSCLGIVFNSASIESVARQVDSSKRVRDARKKLKEEGIVICSGYDNEYLVKKGYRPIRKEEFIAIKA